MRRERTRMEATADLLADPSSSVEDVTLLALVDREVRYMVNDAVSWCLQADNKDRPDAAKYGTHPGGQPRYAPEWYMAQGISTAIHEGLYGCLSNILSCESQDEHGHWCTGSLGHESGHWDGNGCNWVDEAPS